MNLPDSIYLRPGIYTDSDHPDILAYAQRITAEIDSPKAQAIALYRSIRDEFRYYPYHLILKPYALKASYLLSKDYGYCVEKSNLFAACLRALGIPAKLCYANVRNHLATEKVEDYLRTDLMVFHGFVDLFLEGKWVKATPVFNAQLCERLGVAVLDFDGENDAVFQESDKSGRPFMDYVHDYGCFADLPFELFVSELRRHYPHLFDKRIQSKEIIIDF